MTTFSERLKEALQTKKMTQADLARLTGIPTSAINSYIKGKYLAKQDKLHLIANALNVNEAWLMGLEIDSSRIDAMAPSEPSTSYDKQKLKDVLINEINSCEEDALELRTEINTLERSKELRADTYQELSSRISQLYFYMENLEKALKFIDVAPLKFYVHNNVVFFFDDVDNLTEEDYLFENHYEYLNVIAYDRNIIEQVPIRTAKDVIDTFKKYKHKNVLFKLTYSAWFKVNYSKQDILNNQD